MLANATIRSLERHSELYERAAKFTGRPRERIVALSEADELFFRLNTQHYRGLQLVRVATQLTQSVRPREELRRTCESNVVRLLSEIVHDAVAVGDLSLPASHRPDELAFTIWALAFGVRALMDTAVAMSQLRIERGSDTLHRSADLLFDSVLWRPLSHQWDYEHTRQRVRTECFADEWRYAAAAI